SGVGEVIFKEHIGQFNSFKDIRDHLPCVVQECKCCYMYHLALSSVQFIVNSICYLQSSLSSVASTFHPEASSNSNFCYGDMECSLLHGTVFKGTDPYLQYSRNIHLVYIIFIHLVYNGSSLLHLIVYICHLYCLIEITVHGLQFITRITQSRFMVFNSLHG